MLITYLFGGILLETLNENEGFPGKGFFRNDCLHS
jgi:hypothetical protein